MRNFRIGSFAIVVALCLACIGLISPPSHAQSTYGSLSGTVTDASGGAIPGVLVTLTNLDTGSKLTRSTANDGLYQFVNLFPGRYRVDAEKASFKHTTQTDIVVEVQQTSSIKMCIRDRKTSAWQVLQVSEPT